MRVARAGAASRRAAKGKGRSEPVELRLEQRRRVRKHTIVSARCAARRYGGHTHSHTPLLYCASMPVSETQQPRRIDHAYCPERTCVLSRPSPAPGLSPPPRPRLPLLPRSSPSSPAQRDVGAKHTQKGAERDEAVHGLRRRRAARAPVDEGREAVDDGGACRKVQGRFRGQSDAGEVWGGKQWAMAAPRSAPDTPTTTPMS